MRKQYSVRNMIVVSAFLALITWCLSWRHISYSVTRANLAAAVQEKGGVVFYEYDQGVEGFPDRPTYSPGWLSGQEIYFVDLSETSVNDRDFDSILSIAEKLPDSTLYDFSNTKVSEDSWYIDRSGSYRHFPRSFDAELAVMLVLVLCGYVTAVVFGKA